MSDALLRDQQQKHMDVFGVRSPRDPCEPQLQGVLEADLSRQNSRVVGGPHHQTLDQVGRQQTAPQLLCAHVRRHAAQRLQTERGLDVAQVELDVPSPRVQLGEIPLASLLGRRLGGYQDRGVDVHFADPLRGGK